MGKKIVLFCILVFVLSLWSMGTVLGSSDPGQAASVNVRDYGARGNGATDDARAIQAAIDDASTRGIPTVIIPAGHYMVSVEPTAVHLRSNITVQMQSGAVIEAIPTDRRHYNVFHVSGCRNVVIQGGTLVGERNRHLGSGGEWGMGIRISDSSNVTVRDITIKDFWGDGIYIGGGGGGYSRNILIKNADISNNRRQGISMTTGVDGVIIEDCTIHNINGTNPQAGIDIETNDRSIPARNIIIRNNTFFDNVNTDVLIATEAENVEIYGNKMIPGTIRNTPRGVALDFADNVTVRDNKIYDRGHGVQIRDSKNITVDSNLIQGQYQDSVGIIFYHNVDNVRVLGNHIKDIDRGMNIAPVSNIHIEGNIIENTRQYGINNWNSASFGSPRNVTYKDNTIRNIGSFAIMARNNGALLTGNKISEVAGAYVDVRSGTNVVIDGNEFKDRDRNSSAPFVSIGGDNRGIEIYRNTFDAVREAKSAVTATTQSNPVTVRFNIALYSSNPFNLPSGHIVSDNYVKGMEPPETRLEPAPEPEPEPKSNPKPAPEPEPEPKSNLEPAPEPISNPKTNPKPEPELEKSTAKETKPLNGSQECQESETGQVDKAVQCTNPCPEPDTNDKKEDIRSMIQPDTGRTRIDPTEKIKGQETENQAAGEESGSRGPESDPLQFTDIDGHWGKSYLLDLVQERILQGYGDQTLRPDNAVTRAEYLVLLQQVFWQDSEKVDSSTQVFRDAIPTWAADAVALAVKKGVVRGYEDGTFRPHKPITRAELATMTNLAMRTAETTAETTAAPNIRGAGVRGQVISGKLDTVFADHERIPSWAEAHVWELRQQGLIQGYAGSFHPAAAASRAQAAVVFWKILN